MTVSDERIRKVARTLYEEVYEEPFRGKGRGRFCLTRQQLKIALGTQRLHAATIERLQDEALSLGLAIIDLDDLFPCVEVHVIRKYRRPPAEIFKKHFTDDSDNELSDDDDDNDKDS